MARKKKSADYDVIGADPVLRDEDGLSPADVQCDALTETEIKDAISDYLEAGVRLTVTPNHWLLEKDYFVPQQRGLPKKKKLANSGSLYMPAKAIIHAAAMLYSRFQEVEQIFASKQGKGGAKYGQMGEVVGKDGKAIEDAA